MGANSLIQWTDHTFNPWRGCHKISEGCKNCYAATFVQNRQGLQVWGQDAPRKAAAESTWKQPLRWDREAARDGVRRRVFCASLADVFEDYHGPDAAAIPAERMRLFALIEQTPHLLWLLLTKRPENVLNMVPTSWLTAWPANAWSGFTAENQPRFDERWSTAKCIPSPVIFTSIEPQIGPVVLPDDYLTRGQRVWPFIGGESGPGARPFDLAWARALIAQCKAAGVPVFMKQAGAVPVLNPQRIGNIEVAIKGMRNGWMLADMKDKKGGDPGEWPADMRVRELPAAA
jgi:protein gp37